MPTHRLWGQAEALRKLPALTPRIVAAGTYHDATITAPERLVWGLVADGLRAPGSPPTPPVPGSTG